MDLKRFLTSLISTALLCGVATFIAVPSALQQTADDGLPPQRADLESTKNTLGIRLVLIPAGEFQMGNNHTTDEEIALAAKYSKKMSARAFSFEYPSQHVHIQKPFWMSAHHVTRGQFRQFVVGSGYITDAEKGETPGAAGVDLTKGTFSEYQPNRSWRQVGFEQTDEHPVVNVSWNDARAFCKWLSRKEGRNYRLPSEAEWEYACRAGTTTRYWCGEDPEKLALVANIADASAGKRFEGGPTIRANDGFVFTSPAGSFRANPFGLYDMHGNVWQWCADSWWTYGQKREEIPGDKAENLQRVLRGGAWNFTFLDCRCAQRLCNSPSTRSEYYGFRIVADTW